MHKLPGRFATDSHPTFAIIQEVSAGGMGFIIHARHRQTGHDLVLKFILTQSADIIDIERFRREGMLLAALNHPNIVKIHGADVEDGVPFLSMEWIDGQSLKSIIQSAEETNEQPDFESVSDIFQALAQALVHCHKHQILHRDIKPENVLIEAESGRVVLVDFGLAKQLDRLKQNQGESFQLTQTGQMLGTPSYMSPEQIHQQEEDIGPAADIWGFGATLFHYATLQAPFRDSSLLGLMTKILNQDAPELQSLRRDTPEWLNTLISKCLNKSAKLRPSAHDLFRAFEQARSMSGPEIGAGKTKRGALLFAATLAIVVVAVTSFVQSQSGEPQPPKTTKQSTKQTSKIERLPSPKLEIADLRGKAVFLRPGENSRGMVKNAREVTVSVAGQVEVLAVGENGQFTVPSPMGLKPVAIRVSAKNKDSEPVEVAYFLIPLRFKDAFQCRALFDRKQWNRLKRFEQDEVILRVSAFLGSGFSFLETKKYECRGLSHRIASYRHRKTGARLQLLPGGSFGFGSSAKERRAFEQYLSQSPYTAPELKAQSPNWKVYSHSKYTNAVNKIAEGESVKVAMTVGPLLMGQYELSEREWNRDLSKLDLVDKPKVEVSFGQVQSWLAAVGDGLHLPSESQWEYACRAGSTTQFFWGDKLSPAYCWTLESSGGTRIIKALRDRDPLSNAFGLISITGNVWELCADTWITPAEPPAFGSPYIRKSNNSVVSRGGSSLFLFTYCRSTHRRRVSKKMSAKALGFRLTKTLFSVEEMKFIDKFNKDHQ